MPTNWKRQGKRDFIPGEQPADHDPFPKESITNEKFKQWLAGWLEAERDHLEEEARIEEETEEWDSFSISCPWNDNIYRTEICLALSNAARCCKENCGLWYLKNLTGE